MSDVVAKKEEMNLRFLRFYYLRCTELDWLAMLTLTSVKTSPSPKVGGTREAPVGFFSNRGLLSLVSTPTIVSIFVGLGRLMVWSELVSTVIAVATYTCAGCGEVFYRAWPAKGSLVPRPSLLPAGPRSALTGRGGGATVWARD